MSEEHTLKELVIKRSEWMTPNNRLKIGLKDSSLFDSGLRCCLGFACVALGATDKEMYRHTFPRTLPISNRFKQFLPSNRTDYIDSDFTCTAARINDNTLITDEEREKNLIDLFSKNGITLSFVD